MGQFIKYLMMILALSVLLSYVGIPNAAPLFHAIL